MNEQPTEYVCRRCGAALNISVDIVSDGTAKVTNDGHIVVDDVGDSYVEEVTFWECMSCDARYEETGWGLQDGGFDEHYLFKIGSRESEA